MSSKRISPTKFAGCLLVCCGIAQAQDPTVRVLQQLLEKYQGCILERYETQQDMIHRGLDPKTSGLANTDGLQVRDNIACMAGNTCSLANRQAAYASLQAQANAGVTKDFETNLEKAIPADCFQCQEHAEWHTKHVHCTMDCGGNQSSFSHPLAGGCFEGCKAGVDFTKLVKDVTSDIEGALHGLGLGGGTGVTPVTGGASIATNFKTINPDPAQEPCNKKPDGYFIASAELLDWTATDAPAYQQVLTNFRPPASSPTRNQYKPLTADEIDQAGPLNVGANEGRLRDDLRKAAQQANPADSLCKAAKAFALGNETDGNAFADLSVTGRRAFAAFRARPPQEADVLTCLRRDKDVRIQPLSPATLQANAGKALDRAYRVLSLVRAGGRCSAARAALSYIAVSGEDDQPHRPVNVPSAPFPQYDLAVNVAMPSRGRKRQLTVHTRYMIAHTPEPSHVRPPDTCANFGRSVPADAAPVLAPNAEVILFIHGMDSRLEEALDLTRELHKLGQQRGKNYTVISMDLPTSGYADNLDQNEIAPLAIDGQAGGGFSGLGFAPNNYVAPILDFIEDFIVSFVNTLDRGPLHGQLAPKIKAVAGGSLGGNMAMRLGRPRSDAPWIRHSVAWSPAAIWPSFDDSQVQHAALAVPWYFAGGDPTIATEGPGSRRAFFYGGFEWASKIAFFYEPSGSGRPQAEFWYRDGWDCKQAHIHMARIDRFETYDHNFRLWHWRLGMEQLQFSQQEPQPGTNPPQPLYLSNTIPMLLMCGMNDVGGNLCENTRIVAPKMVYTPGYARFLNNTGHSIHNERPNFLARAIVDFVEGQR
jgi:hypothetical protein